MNARKIRNVSLIKEDIYLCDVEIYSDSEKKWIQVPYVVNKNDTSEINSWIFEQLSTNKYKIKDQRA